MNDKLEKILKQFTKIVLRWLTANLNGTLTLTININQGGITDWNIQTNGKWE